MPRLRFDREFSHPIDTAGRKKTYPAGWEGFVEDEKIAGQAVKEGHAVEINPPAPAAEPAGTADSKGKK